MTKLIKKYPPDDYEKYCNLYENEKHSDVILLVGADDCQERVPGHTWVLANGSDYFRALFQGPLANSGNGVHHFPDNPKGFNNLIRWIYQNQCELHSLQCGLDTLQVSIKYLCPELADECIRYMTTQLTVKNVLTVLSWIHCYCANPDSAPSAPSLEKLEQAKTKDSQDFTCDDTLNTISNRESYSCLDPTTSCYQLLNLCLDLIDKQTDEVLDSECLATVDPPILHLILQRDTLKLSSELHIVTALCRWSTARCKRQGMPLTMANKRNALGSLLFMTRLLTLAPADLGTSYAQMELRSLLTEEELTFITTTVQGSSEHVVPYSMVDFERLMATKREAPPDHLFTLKEKKPKNIFRKKFNKRAIVLDLVSFLAMIFD